MGLVLLVYRPREDKLAHLVSQCARGRCGEGGVKERRVTLYVYSLIGSLNSLHNATAPLSVSEFLKKHETEFFTAVNPRQSLLRLIRKGVITEDVKSSIDVSNTKDALEILYDHLKRYGSVNTLLEYCEMAIDADDLPNMQSFGRRIKEQLQQGG